MAAAGEAKKTIDKIYSAMPSELMYLAVEESAIAVDAMLAELTAFTLEFTEMNLALTAFMVGSTATQVTTIGLLSSMESVLRKLYVTPLPVKIDQGEQPVVNTLMDVWVASSVIPWGIYYESLRASFMTQGSVIVSATDSGYSTITHYCYFPSNPDAWHCRAVSSRNYTDKGESVEWKSYYYGSFTKDTVGYPQGSLIFVTKEHYRAKWPFD